MLFVSFAFQKCEDISLSGSLLDHNNSGSAQLQVCNISGSVLQHEEMKKIQTLWQKYFNFKRKKFLKMKIKCKSCVD